MSEAAPSKRSGTVRDLLAAALAGRELARVALGLLLLFGLAVPIVHTLRLAPPTRILWGGAFVVVLARVPLRGRAIPLSIVAGFAAFMVFQLLVVENHVVAPISDFATQWDTAVDYAQNGLRVPHSPQTQRALPWFYPLVRCFGASPTVYVAANVVLMSLAFLMVAWIARRYFGWAAAAKTALLLPFAYETYFANTIPSHDILGAFGVVLVIFVLGEIEAVIATAGTSRFGRRRRGLLAGLTVFASLAITWVEWQRSMGMFCAAAALFYGVVALIQRIPRARLRIVVALALCLLSGLEATMLKSGGLIATEPATSSNSFEMGMMAFASEEGDGQQADWYRTWRVASQLGADELTRLSRMMLLETLRTEAAAKYANYLFRQITFLRAGRDADWYFTIASSRWLTPVELRAVYRTFYKWTTPIWWALGLLVGLAAILRREVLFDVRLTPLILLTSFMVIMGLVGETQSRYALFMVFVWPIYIGAPFLLDPLPAHWQHGFSRHAAGSRLMRLAISVTAVIAIPGLLVAISPRWTSVRLANLERVEVTPRAGASEGALPVLSASRNFLTVSDAAAGSPDGTVRIAVPIEAKDASSTLHFVLENMVGTEHAPIVVERRALRVFIDGALLRTIDLTTRFDPQSIEVPGVGEGVHDVRLELDLGASGPQQRCVRDWTGPQTCLHIAIAYLGFY